MMEKAGLRVQIWRLARKVWEVEENEQKKMFKIYFQGWERLGGEKACCANVSTQGWIPSTHVKLGMAASPPILTNHRCA